MIDSRLEPQKIDIEFCCSLGERGIPFILAFTKADKQGNGKSQQNMAMFKKELLAFFEEVPQMILTSAETQLGKEDILKLIHQINQDFTIPEYDTAFYT